MTMAMKRSSAAVVVASTTALLVVSYKVLRWRARTRAKKTVERVQTMIPENRPLIDWEDEKTRDRILHAAVRRASKWMSLSKDARPMVGQVGGVSVHKRPLLTLKPDYVLKPLVTDHRGIREIAFYEALRTQSKAVSPSSYATFLQGKEKMNAASTRAMLQHGLHRCGELFDTLAMTCAIFLHDPVVTQSEAALQNAWKTVKKEVDAVHKLAKFTAPYYGVVGQRGGTLSKRNNSTLGLTEDVHLLLQDLTINFVQPCVMDLKMGTQTYEPDAPEEKRKREFHKYPEQSQFGFRIVGMRVYDPAHPDAGEALSPVPGYRFFGKQYGRGLKTHEQLLEAMRQYFSAGIENSNTTDGSSSERIRRKVISNVLAQLKPLRRWYDDNKSLRFYASSILIVYEGDVHNEAGNKDSTTIKMIDFGRVRREFGGDQGYSLGLRTLKNLLVDLLHEEDERLEALEQGPNTEAAIAADGNDETTNMDGRTGSKDR